MASEKQISANRANALKGHGPRSAGGKARSSRNATRHGLAANIWKQASAVRSIEQLTQLFRADGHSEQKARLAAVAEYQTKAIRNVRCRIGEQIFEAADVRGSEETLVKNLRRLQSIDRYERRIDSLKKKVFQKMQREI
jgi:serine phosphatase RsbU (regulator of sigma subunit)